jgi:hypothetical protein
MNTPDPKPSLEQLVEGAAQGMREQQAKAAAQTARQPAPRRGRVVLAGTLALVCAGLLAVQAPRIAAPYEWPDPDRNPVVADADLETMVGLIEAYRLARGRYPASLADISLPQGLAEVVAGSKLEYRLAETSFALEWTLPHWQANYSSESGQASVQPRSKT